MLLEEMSGEYEGKDVNIICKFEQAAIKNSDPVMQQPS